MVGICGGIFVTRTDRRILRTRELLQQALVTLVSERRYEAITVQDIVDRANVGRTTFYLHYTNKHELFMGCHEAIVAAFNFGPESRLSREQFLADQAPPGRVAGYRHLAEVRTLLSRVFHSKESPLLLRHLHDWSVQELEASLRAAFPESDGAVSLDVLANYLAAAQVALVQRYLERHQPYTPEELAQMCHRLQRAAIRDAFNLTDGS